MKGRDYIHVAVHERVSDAMLKVYVVSTADPGEIQTLFLSEFKKARTIRDCEQIRNGIITGGSPPPWWYIVAKKLLTRIYRSKGRISVASLVVRRILTYEAICEDNSRKCVITDHDKLKIADAMIWIHQNEDLPNKITGSDIDRCLSFIRKQVCQKLNLH